MPRKPPAAKSKPDERSHHASIRTRLSLDELTRLPTHLAHPGESAQMHTSSLDEISAEAAVAKAEATRCLELCAVVCLGVCKTGRANISGTVYCHEQHIQLGDERIALPFALCAVSSFQARKEAEEKAAAEAAEAAAAAAAAPACSSHACDSSQPDKKPRDKAEKEDSHVVVQYGRDMAVVAVACSVGIGARKEKRELMCLVRSSPGQPPSMTQRAYGKKQPAFVHLLVYAAPGADVSQLQVDRAHPVCKHGKTKTTTVAGDDSACRRCVAVEVFQMHHQVCEPDGQGGWASKSSPPYPLHILKDDTRKKRKADGEQPAAAADAASAVADAAAPAAVAAAAAAAAAPAANPRPSKKRKQAVGAAAAATVATSAAHSAGPVAMDESEDEQASSAAASSSFVPRFTPSTPGDESLAESDGDSDASSVGHHDRVDRAPAHFPVPAMRDDDKLFGTDAAAAAATASSTSDQEIHPPAEVSNMGHQEDDLGQFPLTRADSGFHFTRSNSGSQPFLSVEAPMCTNLLSSPLIGPDQVLASPPLGPQCATTAAEKEPDDLRLPSYFPSPPDDADDDVFGDLPPLTSPMRPCSPHSAHSNSEDSFSLDYMSSSPEQPSQQQQQPHVGLVSPCPADSSRLPWTTDPVSPNGDFMPFTFYEDPDSHLDH